MTRKVFLILSFCLLGWSLAGQCPDRDSLLRRLLWIKDSSTDLPAQKLSTLLNYVRIVDECPDKYDSVNAFLSKLIAATYAEQADFINAIKYCKRSISILTGNENEFFRDREFIIERYYRLSAYSDSINDVAGKMEALDS